MRKMLLFVVLSLFLVGCGLDLEEPAPTPDVGSGYPVTAEGFPIINHNPNLILLDMARPNEYQQTSYDVPQTYNYDGYDIHYYGFSVDGEANPYPVEMLTEPGNMELFVQGSAGEMGLSTTVNLPRGCYGVKGDFDADIDDRRHPQNHSSNVRVTFPASGQSQLLGAKRIYMTTDNQKFFIFFVDSQREVVIELFYHALFGTAGDNSMVNIRYFWVIDLPDDYC